MNDSDLIAFLDRYGHLRQPFGEVRDIVDRDLDRLTLNSQIVRDALESYQSFHALPLERIALGIFGTGGKIVSGEMDKPTTTLLSIARCDCPDYAAMESAEAGNGNWDGCHGVGPFHCANIRLLNDPPATISPLFETIWNRVVDAYSEVGLLLTRDPETPSNIDVSFVRPDGGWIGLAIVGSGQGCQDRIWAKFDNNYRPANLVSEWTTLIKHEFGHNCGLQHSQGGVMNPYIVAGLPVSWAGDVSRPLLAKRFGGEPVPRTPTSRTLVLAWQLGPNQYEVIQVLDTTKPPGGIFQ